MASNETTLWVWGSRPALGVGLGWLHHLSSSSHGKTTLKSFSLLPAAMGYANTALTKKHRPLEQGGTSKDIYSSAPPPHQGERGEVTC